MDGIYGYMLTISVLSVCSGVCGYLLPRGSLGASGKRALSLMVLLYALKPIVALIGGG